MNKRLRVLLIFMIAGSLLTQVNAQNKPKEAPKKTTTKPKTTDIRSEDSPPPRQEEMTATDTAAVAIPGSDYPALDSATMFRSVPKPMVDFDTTAVVDDEFTRDIMKMLKVTNALDLGFTFAENLKSEEVESNPMLKEFYARFMADLKAGTTRRWFERTFVREYRKTFTHQEIKDLLAFYDTPLGRKVVRSSHEMLPSCMEQGKKIGGYMGAKMFYEMIKQGGN